MRSRRPFLIILLLATAVLLIFLFSRRTTQADFGTAASICPGPDLYGYTCIGGAGFAYIDATQDTQLYEDDGTVLVELPFPFTFYGRTYSELNASSNGNIQFGKANPRFDNTCLVNQPALEMGDLIAPYWDDLDLQLYGYLETETVGEAPDRIFVLEWDDVPRFSENSDDRVTFAIQLFENSHDIIFFYEDVTAFEGHNGASATIGLQSEEQRLALQFSCEQAAIADTGRIHFPHPESPNPDINQEEAEEQTPSYEVTAKGNVVHLIDALNQSGSTVLPQLQTRWRNQSPSRATVWEWADVTGNGRSDLILLWFGGVDRPELAQLTILSPDETDQMSLLFTERLSTRTNPVAELSIAKITDLTEDGRSDILLLDNNGQLSVITTANGSLARLPIPERCQGSLAILDTDNDGRPEIVRDGCEMEGRTIVTWDGRQFTIKES